MTKKDYELIADIIHDLGYSAARSRAEIAEEFADGLATENSRFDRERFLRACGVAT